MKTLYYIAFYLRYLLEGSVLCSTPAILQIQCSCHCQSEQGVTFANRQSRSLGLWICSHWLPSKMDLLPCLGWPCVETLDKQQLHAQLLCCFSKRNIPVSVVHGCQSSDLCCGWHSHWGLIYGSVLQAYWSDFILKFVIVHSTEHKVAEQSCMLSKSLISNGDTTVNFGGSKNFCCLSVTGSSNPPPSYCVLTIISSTSSCVQELQTAGTSYFSLSECQLLIAGKCEVWNKMDVKSFIHYFFKYFMTMHWCFSMRLKPTSAYENIWIHYTGLFISPSVISKLDCATTKTDTAERSISIGRESLQVSVLHYRCSICAPLVTWQMSIL